MSSSKAENLVFFGLTVVLLLIIVLLSFNQKIEGNLSGQQAMAFLRGELTIPNDDALLVYQDLVFYKDKIYSPLPPGPAVLLVPFVLIGGQTLPILVLTIPLTLLSLLLLVKIYEHISEAVPLKLWLAFGFIFGTALLPCLQVGGYAWFLGNIVAVCFVLLSLYLSFCIPGAMSWKGALAGLAMAIAFLSRQMTIFLTLFVVVLLWQNSTGTRQRKILLIIAFLIPVGIGVLVYLTYNWAKFNNPFETGYAFVRLPTEFLSIRGAHFNLLRR